jgi:tetratricopeptide (TPR) repeat protein
MSTPRFKSLSTVRVEVTPQAEAAIGPSQPTPPGQPAAGGGADGVIAPLYRAYLDLSEVEHGATHAFGVGLAYRHLVGAQRPVDWVQQLHPPAFRQLLARYVGNPAVAEADPRRALTDAHTTEAARLIEWIDAAAELPPFRQVALAKLIVALGFNQFPMVLFGRPGPDAMRADDGRAELAYVVCAARANHCLGYALGRPGSAVRYWPTDLEELAATAPPSSRARMDTAMRLCVFYGKVRPDADAVDHYAAIAESAFDRLDTGGDAFHRDLVRCKMLRAVCFAPMLRHQPDRLTAHLDEAERLARSLDDSTADHAMLKRENLSVLMETRTREAQWLGDLDRAQQRLTESVSLNELDPMRHMVLGELLLHRRQWTEAALSFQRSAWLGPSTSPMAWFMAGYAQERSGNPHAAVGSYLSCLSIDPGAVSASDRIRVLAAQAGLGPLGALCRTQLRSIPDTTISAPAVRRRIWDQTTDARAVGRPA